MKRFPIFAASAVCLLLGISTATRAQDLSESLSKVSSAYAGFYVQPLTDALGANYNTGLFHTADNGPRTGFHMYVGVKVFASTIKNKDKTFDADYQSPYVFDRSIDGERVKISVPGSVTVRGAPTFFGSSDQGSISVRIRQDTSITFREQSYTLKFDSTFTIDTISGIVDLPAMPAAAPQIEIGTFLGTDALIRFLPAIDTGDVGRLGILGLGLRHSISQYIPSIPFHLAVQGVWQNLFLDDPSNEPIVDLRMWAVNVQASKKIGILTVFGGVQAEDSRASITYTFEEEILGVLGRKVDPVEISLDLDGANLFRVIGGLGVDAGPVNIALDLNVGKVQSASFSLGVVL